MKLDLHIPDNIKYIVIGVSAGPDSMALLHYIKNNTNINIICAHINHNVRKESQEEEDYLKKYCKDNNIIFESHKIDKYTENNFENEARKKRYEFYYKILKKYKTNYLYLAHHGDDLIETVLMKIVRGSNLEGYAGIKEISKINNIYIIRPLLDYTKEDLINYNKKNNMKYYIDHTNNDNTYTRNRYRNNILPILKNEDINIHKKFKKYSETLLEYDKYIKKETDKKIKSVYKNNTIDITRFNKLDNLIKKNILYTILNKTYNNKPNIIKEKHIEEIIKICNKDTNKEIQLPQDIKVIKEYNKLIILRNEEKEDYNIKINNHTEYNDFIIKRINKTENNGNNICRLNTKELKLPLYIRNAKKGDKIKVLGLNGTKLVYDILMEKKIPKYKRNSYPILTDSKNEILWIPNLKKSKFNIEKNGNYDIILEYITKEEK